MATLNPASGVLEYQPVLRLTSRHYSGDLVHFTGRRVDLLVTPDHHIYRGFRDRLDHKSFRLVADEDSPRSGRPRDHDDHRLSMGRQTLSGCPDPVGTSGPPESTSWPRARSRDEGDHRVRFNACSCAFLATTSLRAGARRRSVRDTKSISPRRLASARSAWWKQSVHSDFDPG